MTLWQWWRWWSVAQFVECVYSISVYLCPFICFKRIYLHFFINISFFLCVQSNVCWRWCCSIEVDRVVCTTFSNRKSSNHHIKRTHTNNNDKNENKKRKCLDRNDYKGVPLNQYIRGFVLFLSSVSPPPSTEFQSDKELLKIL